MAQYIGYFIVAIIIGYFCGCIQSGFFVGKLSGIDIRQYGSGNAGTTNVLRTLGAGKALITFLGDALKGFIPVLLVKFWIAPSLGMDQGTSQLLQLILGFGVVLGHDYPFFLKFKGGKGIATSGAVMMAFDWRIGLCCLLIFAVIVGITRYVSLGSCILSAGIVIEMIIFHPGQWDLVVMAILYAWFAIYRHRANIKRLISGTESKLGQKVEVKK
ncbi:MAG: glycerol-3-phosphate 1-O-acyltransferase PlsY [Clostridiales bacterium]|nr:glycerol-3-phosphate 1-O-acyltransferase PlsY [Clostridiales bacterium]